MTARINLKRGIGNSLGEQVKMSSWVPLHDYKGRLYMLTSHNTLLPNMYHKLQSGLFVRHNSNMHQDNTGRLTVNHTLLPNMYHYNRGRLSVHHTLLPNNHDNRGRHSAHQTLLPYMYNDNRGSTLLTTPCYQACTMITKADYMSTPPCNPKHTMLIRMKTHK